MRLDFRRLGSLRFAGPALLFVLWIVVALMSISIARQDYRHEAIRQTERMARQVGARLIRYAERYAVSDPRLVREELSLISSEPSLIEAVVVDGAGAVLFANNRALIGHPYPELESATGRALLEQALARRLAQVATDVEEALALRFVGAYQPPPDSHELRADERGAVYLRYDLGPGLREATRHAFLERLPDILMMIMVTGLALLLSRRHIVEPLDRIARSAAAVKAGHFEPIEAAAGSTEVRNLANAFNEMTAQIARQLRELSGQTEHLRAVLDNMHDGVLVTDDQGRITLFSKAAEAIFLHSAAQVLGEHYSLLLDPQSDSRQRLRKVLEEHHGSTYGSAVELTGLRRDRSRFAMDNRIASFVVDSKPMYVSVVRDITERKLVEAELSQHRHHLETLVSDRTRELQSAREAADAANAAKSAFLAAMSHEIRTPMNGVIGMLDVLAQTSLQSDQMEMLGVVRDSAQALLGIINDVLDFSKIEAGKLDVVSEEFVLDDQLEQVLTLMDHFARRKRVDLNLTLDPALPELLQGDYLRLRQVLNNLISNAIKFSSQLPRPGQVDVEITVARTEDQGCWVNFSVRDNGIGMHPEAFARLFNSFEQADASTTRRYGGTGLGLAIVKRLVDLMGGQLSVESTPDVGSVFVVGLPFTLIERLTEPPLSGLDCLVVGPGDAVTARYVAYLAQAGGQLRQVPDIEQALQLRDAHLWVVVNANNELPEATLLAAARLAVPTGTRMLVLEHGHRRLPRRAAEGLMLVDGNVITRRKLTSLVARLSGLLPESPALTLNAGTGHQTLLSRAEALALGRLVLVAEDNEINQTVIRRQLGLLGCAADVAVNGREALQMWQQTRYPLVLTDLHMPEVDGYQFTSAIRAEEVRLGRPRTPIVALTANVLKDEAAHCLSVGMDGYATKPVPLPELQRLLEQWLPALPSPSAAASSPPSDSAVHLDLAVLRGLVGDDPDTLNELLTDFRHSTPATGETLRALSAAGQLAELGRAAHRFKSAARSIGALALGAACEALEQAAKAGDEAKAGPLLAGLLGELATVEAELDRALGAR